MKGWVRSLNTSRRASALLELTDAISCEASQRSVVWMGVGRVGGHGQRGLAFEILDLLALLRISVVVEEPFKRDV